MMAEKSCRVNRVAPRELHSSKSWITKSTAQKIYAIRVNDGELPNVHGYGYQLVERKSPVKSARKWIGKCKWKVPVAMLAFSIVQVKRMSRFSNGVDNNFLS
jgi:membrane associated rhomboid family serine protease